MAIVRPDAGKMRYPVRFENADKIPDGAGGRKEDFVSYVNTRGYMVKDNGSVGFTEGTEELVSQWQMFVYWRRAFDSYVTKDTQVVYNNRFYKIVSKERVDETNSIMYLTLINVE